METFRFTFEAATRSPRVAGDEVDDLYGAAAGFGDAFGVSEVDLADHLGGGRGGSFERAAGQYQVDRGATDDPAGLEALAGGVDLQAVDRVGSRGQVLGHSPACVSADLARGAVAYEDVEQHDGQFPIRARDAPIAIGAQGRAVPGDAAGPVRWRARLPR